MKRLFKFARLMPCLALAVIVCASFAHGADVDEAATNAVYEQHIQPLLRKYCFGCHGPNRQPSEINLHQYASASSITQEPETWEKVIEMLEFGAMPPEGKPRPSDEEYARIVRGVKSILDKRRCDIPLDAGRVTIRRLNRIEYNNTIRDLVGVDIQPGKDFPSDDVGDGFDNQGDVLSISPLLFEKYVDAAERIAAAAIVVSGMDVAPRQLRQRKQLTPAGNARPGYDGQYVLVSAGSVTGEFSFPRAGEYMLRVRAGADQAGDELAKMKLTLDDREITTIDVDASRDDPQDYEIVRNIESAGRQRLSAAFINDYYRPDAPNPNDRDRNLFIHSLEVIGPINIRPEEFPESHRRLITVRPDEHRTLRQAAQAVLAPLVQRAFRRPVAGGEVESYVRLVEQAVSRGANFERGIQVAITAILVSPHFLFRVENNEQPGDANTNRGIDDFELATRLSYFLWSTMPDATLSDLARQGMLHKEPVLAAQVRRMLQDPRSIALAENFGGQWLNLRNLEQITPDPRVFGDFDKQLRDDMRRETELFFHAIVREDRSVLDFISGDFTFLNERLANHYGIDDYRGKDFGRYTFREKKRSGVLTQASILTLTSNPNRTSPVKRGKWILENILGTPPPDPPANVPQLAETQRANPNASFREQLELHRKNPTCASCHRHMDELGFGFENFDAIGRWRDTDGNTQIDASGVLPSGDAFSGPAELVSILAGRKREFCGTLAGRMLVYALGRGLKSYDKCTIDKIVERMENENYRLSSLVMGVVMSEPFLERRAEGDQ